jgi:hypothetical protein
MPRSSFLLSVRTRLQYNGPIFDDRGRRIFDEFRDELEEESAEFVLDHVKGTFHTHFKNPTGYYESNVRINAAKNEVWDGGLAGPVYGPWLEGIGSRNNTTRFRGYHAFRKAANALERRVEDMGDRIFRLRYQNRLE